ncbi:hypothetical protein QBZ16_001116 [Prototheca wickerhamii]|uniref:Gamma-tubulin complex component n=1 Tax=Prototheca wickerhamii TaxID=3111 RepID=A0AAD9MG68_PROWI|nr:hypothetical protein QBZ16_001116 [Prototheca wickerhamii]
MAEVPGPLLQQGEALPVESQSIYADLLLALLGHDGDVFIKAEDADRIQLSELVDWIPDADRPHLDHLCRLGGACLAIQAYIDDAEERGSAYQAALATGAEEVLALYREAVLDVERELLAAPGSPVGAISQRLDEFQVVLPAVARLCAYIRAGDVRGAALLRAVHAAARCGDPLLESCAERLAWHVRGVLLRQLHAWCLHGELAGDEFFLQGAASGEEGAVRVADELPPDVSARAAEAALFVGKAARVLLGSEGAALAESCIGCRADRGAWAAERDKEDAGLYATSSYDSAVPQGTARKVPTTETYKKDANDDGSDADASADRALRRLAEDLRSLAHQAAPRPSALERALEEARGALAVALWALLRGARLAACLAAVRRYVLLERGDFWAGFLEEAEAALDAGSGLSSADVARLFQQAALGTSAEDDEAFGMFALELGGAARDDAPAPRPGGLWARLELRVRVPWPAQVLFGDASLARYGRLWRLGVALRRVDGRLAGDWLRLARLERRGGGARPPAAALRRYLHTDLARLLGDAFAARLAAARDVAVAEAAHERFLRGLLCGAFLTGDHPLAGVLQALMDLAGRLHALAEALEAGAQGAGAATTRAAVADIERELRLRAGLFLDLLRSGGALARQPGEDHALNAVALSHLTLRLAFDEA